MSGLDVPRVPPNPRMVEITVRYACGCEARETRRAATGHGLPSQCKQHPHAKIKMTRTDDINRGSQE